MICYGLCHIFLSLEANFLPFLRYHGRWIDSVWKSCFYAGALKEHTITCTFSERLTTIEYIYVIYRAGGPYGKKNCARGLEYDPRPKPRAVLKTNGTDFSHTDRPSPVNNIFIFFWTSSFRKRGRNKGHSVCSFPRA